MPSAGLHRMANADLTIKKLKGKQLTKAVGKVFAPEAILKRNSELSSGKPSAGYKVGGKK